ncbi:hypothetical protein V2J09_021795 [Rumex salicifolius]
MCRPPLLGPKTSISKSRVSSLFHNFGSILKLVDGSTLFLLHDFTCIDVIRASKYQAMGNESQLDRGFGPQHPSVDGCVVNGVSAESLPTRGAAEVGGSRCMDAEFNGDGSVGAKRKRGRPPKGGGAAKVVAAPVVKRIKEEEDVCFICFDGGNLVLCDRRDCPKAYHPACVKRDESYFTPRLRWNCGWHLCNICQRNALFMCYTCPYSLCKTCAKQADISCVRGNKGFCKTCMTFISLIENIKQGNDQVAHVDFDDATSWEYLFKVYWVLLKQKESLTLDELTRATNPWKVQIVDHVNNHVELSRTAASVETNNNQVETSVCKRRKTRKQLPMQNNSCERIVTYKLQESDLDWGSKELLEFVSYVKNGDKSKLTQFDVQALLLEYIRKNKLRDPRRKCQIICDKRLELLFGKARLGHFEMLKLLEYHFKDSPGASSGVRAAAFDSYTSDKLEECTEESNTVAKERKKQAGKKGNEKGKDIKLDSYAAIDVHNMSLIYLRRNSMESLLEGSENFHDKVVGSIVRIRIADNDLKQEMYRLVQVVGTGKAAEPYKIGDKTAHVILKILNLDKIEDVRIDAISNQDLSEDECIRLCHNIKCGLVERMTVGDIHKKAIVLQEVRIKDVIETEISKLNHLRDRATYNPLMSPSPENIHCLFFLTSSTLREYVEKLELLKSPEERLRRMHEIPEVHADPRMDPNYQSGEESEQSATEQDVSMTPIHSISNSSVEVAARSSSSNWDSKRNVSDKSQIKEDDAARSLESSQSTLDLEKDAARILEELRNQVEPCRISTKHEVVTLVNHPRDASDASVTSSSRSVLSRNNTEFEKIWHYQDPSGRIQGPFFMVQLRKWNSDGYFPVDLRIWRIDESQDKSMLLTDVLSNQCNEDLFQSDCLEPNEPRFVSGSRSPEHGGQLSININAPWTNDKPHDGCNSDLIDAVRCSDDKIQPTTEPDLQDNHKSSLVVNSHGEEVSNVCPASSNTVSRTVDENHKSSLVASSHGGEVSITCLASKDTVVQTVDQNNKSSLVVSCPAGEVSNASIASRDTIIRTVSQNIKPDFSDLPTLMPNGSDKEPIHLDVEPQQKVSASNVSNCISGSGLAMPSGRLEFPNLFRSAIKLETDNQVQEVNKIIADLRCETEEHNLPENSRKITVNCTDLPTQTPELNKDATNSHAVEFKEPVASYIHGQDSFTSWQALATGILPVSSITQNSECAKGLATDLNLSSNANCQDVGFSWSSAASLAIDLDSEMKFSDHDATTTTSNCQFTHSLTSQLDCNASIWHDGLIELSTLGDESVSDLLSEVEAMESLHGLPSPSSRIDFGDDPIGSPSNECFSPLVGLSLPLMTTKHDTWNSNCDIQFRPQPTITDPQPSYSLNLHDDSRVKQEYYATDQQDFLSLNCTPLPSPRVSLSFPMNSLAVDSHGHPPTSLSLSSMDSFRGPKMDIQEKLSNGSLNLGFVSLHHTPEPSLTPLAMPDMSTPVEVAQTAQQSVANAAVPSSPKEAGEVMVAARLSLELSVNVPATSNHSPKDQLRRKVSGFGEEPKTNNSTTAGIPSSGLSPSPRDGKSRSLHRSSPHSTANQGNRAGQQTRHHGNGGRHYHQNIDPGPGFLKPAKPWGRQSSFSSGGGGGGGGFNRGQRVCKFYESGYCKKGALCNYLHP